VTCQTALPNFDNFQGMAQIISRFVKEAVTQTGPKNGPNTYIEGEVVQESRVFAMSYKNLLKDVISKHKAGHKQQPIPTDGQKAGK